MKRTVMVTIVVMYLWAIAFTYIIIKSQGNTNIQQQEVHALATSLAKTRQDFTTVRSQVYEQLNEQSTWLAELQVDVWNLQAQDEAFSRRLR